MTPMLVLGHFNIYVFINICLYMYTYVFSHLLLLYTGRVHGAISGCTVLWEVHPASAQNKSLISDTDIYIYIYIYIYIPMFLYMKYIYKYIYIYIYIWGTKWPTQ